MPADASDVKSRSLDNSSLPSSGQASEASTSQRAHSPRERKGGLSCAECRRSKLKCDRNVPCQACIRRGCAKLCPNGMMPATKGNKALQSHAQKLGEQVTSMSVKIKELESALAAAHLQIRTDPPEDKPESKGLDRRRMYGVASGSLAIDRGGLSRYFGDTSASEYFTGPMPMNQSVNNACHQPDLQALNLPPEIATLFNAFPFGLRDRPYSASVFSPFIPARNKAAEIAGFFYDRYGSIYNPVPYEDFTDELLGKIYSSRGMVSAGGLHPHRLALFFAIMAIGHQRSIDFATANGLNLNAERYYVLACAALSLAPIIVEAMCATVQTLFLVVSYIGCGTRRGCEESWLLIGVMARLSLRIGLHRDGAQFNLNSAELKRRRHIFWELLRLDVWVSFATGRAPAINLADTDTKFPEFEGDSSLMPYPHWKYRHTAACLWPTTRLATADVAPYEETMALDRKIRTFPVPTHLQASLQGPEVWSWSTSPSKAVQQYCIVSDKEFCLLFLHRNYLAVALRTENPLAHKFGGSVLAGHRCATRMCFALRDLHRLHPRVVSSMWFFWYRILSSCIILAAIPIMAPGCSLAQNALTTFKETCQLFAEAAATNSNIYGLELLRKLERRADNNFMSYWANPSNFKHTHPPPSALHGLGLSAGQEAVPGSSRSHSNSPNPLLVSQVSHMRTQPPRLDHPERHDASHTSTPTFGADAYPDFTDGADPSSYQQLFRDLASVADNTYTYPDVDQAFLSSSVPTYEQIMQGSMPYFTGRAQMFLSPDHGFHPSPGFSPEEHYNRGAFNSITQPMDSSMLGANPELMHANTFWDSFISDLMGRGGSPAGGTQYNLPYGM